MIRFVYAEACGGMPQHSFTLYKSKMLASGGILADNEQITDNFSDCDGNCKLFSVKTSPLRCFCHGVGGIFLFRSPLQVWSSG